MGQNNLQHWLTDRKTVKSEKTQNSDILELSAIQEILHENN